MVNMTVMSKHLSNFHTGIQAGNDTELFVSCEFQQNLDWHAGRECPFHFYTQNIVRSDQQFRLLGLVVVVEVKMSTLL